MSSSNKSKPIAFGDPDLSDVTLIMEKHEFLLHKMVLANRSDVFKDLFHSRFKKANPNRIRIKNVSPAAFRQLMELLYDRAVKDRFSLFPGDCYSAKSRGMREIWCLKTGLSQLLKVADVFNMSLLVMHELMDVYGQMPCRKTYCFRCISIYLLLHDRDGTFTPLNQDGPYRTNRKFGHLDLASAARAIAGEKEKRIPMDDAKLIKFAKQLESREADEQLNRVPRNDAKLIEFAEVFEERAAKKKDKKTAKLAWGRRANRRPG